MPSRKPTKIESDEFVRAHKITTAKIRWRPEGKGWRVQAKVSAVELKEMFEIRGYIGRTNFSFALLYRNHPLRKFTAHAPHRIGSTLVKEPHKHVWDGQSENNEAYIPQDIDPKTDINDQFLAFCRECNIDILGEYQYVAPKL